MISEFPFECDVTQLLPGSHVDEQDYLIGKDGKVYDLDDADVIAEIDLADVEVSDIENEEALSGVIVDTVYKGDHYQVMIRTELEEEFIFESMYTWNVNDIVWITVPKDKIKLKLKGDIKKYVKE